VGGGLDIRIAQWTNKQERVQSLFINLGVQYLRGQQAEYLAEGELRDLNNDGVLSDDELPIRRSRTDLIQPKFGISVTF
jgi:hypothetical protein